MFTTDIIRKIASSLPDTLPYNPAKQRIADRAAIVGRTTLHALTGLFTGLALLAVTLRISLHLRRRGRLFVDDYLVLFAASCLVIDTAVLYYIAPRIFILETLAFNPINIFLFSKREILSLFGVGKWVNIYLAFVWTANYAIKWSFLAFFKTLIRGVSKHLQKFWYFVVGFTIVTWLFNILENPINCGWDNDIRCFPYPFHLLAIGLSVVTVDIATDLMIILIPILLLRKSFLDLGQKLRILSFLCLNVFCIAIALIRGIMRISSHHEISGQFQFRLLFTIFLEHIEASVAVIMGSVTALRTVFASRIHSRGADSAGGSWSKLFCRLKSWFRREDSSSDIPGTQSTTRTEKRLLPAMGTGITIRGLRTFIRRHQRDPGATTRNEAPDDTQFDPFESYHNYIRNDRARKVTEGNHNQATNGSTKMTHAREIRSEMLLPTIQIHDPV